MNQDDKGAPVAAAGVPEGWRLVPVPMTPDMLRAVQVHSELGAHACANLSGAYDLLQELWRVAVAAAPALPSEPAPFLFIAMDDDKRAHLTWCADESEVRAAALVAMFWLRDGESLSADHAEQLQGVVEELLDSGCMTFEGDPPLYLYRVAHNPAAAQAPVVLTHADSLADLHGTPRPDNPTPEATAAQRAEAQATGAQADAPYHEAMARVRKALADRDFRDASEPEDLLRMAANVIAEDGDIIAALKARSAPTQPVQGAYLNRNGGVTLCANGAEDWHIKHDGAGSRLYAQAPAAAVPPAPLTDERIAAGFHEGQRSIAPITAFSQGARWAERAHGITGEQKA